MFAYHTCKDAKVTADTGYSFKSKPTAKKTPIFKTKILIVV